MSQSTVNDLIKNAGKDQGFGAQALTTMRNIGNEIQDSLGMPAINLPYQDVTLLVILIDDSGSISNHNNEQHIIDGYNQIIQAVQESKNPSVMVCTKFLNHGDLNPFCLIQDAPLLDDNNYKAYGGTPLYDKTIEMLSTIAIKSQEFIDNGIPVRTISVIITDGDDEHSIKSATDVAPFVKSLLRAEAHIMAAMGIDDGSTDFRQVFKEMGFKDEWILTPGNTKHELRDAFKMVSKSVSKASKNANSFSKAVLGGGFTNP